MQLRRVRYEDAVAFLAWWNDRETRRFSGIGGPITWDTHLRWFFENMSNPHWYVGEVPEAVINDVVVRARPVGACRIDAPDAHGKRWISIVCDPRERGKGYGSELIRLVTETYQREAKTAEMGLVYPPGCVYANIHILNTPSRRAFEKAGYEHVKTDDVWTVYRKS